jgi:hypothetical protein
MFGVLYNQLDKIDSRFEGDIANLVYLERFRVPI